MTNPNNAVGTNAAYGGRTSVNAFNDDLTIYSRGILSGWACSPKSGMTVQIGGNGADRDAAVAEDNAGNKTSINNISGSPIDVTIPAAPATNNRIDLIVAYADNPPSGTSTVVDNPAACGIIVVSGTAASSPTAPTNATIRSAITADGASGSTAYYVILAQIRVGTGVTTIGSGVITQGAKVESGAKAGASTVSTNSIADGAVTSDKVDYTTFSRMTVRLSADINPTSMSTIGLSLLGGSTGTQLTQSGGGIKVGSGVSKVRVSASVFYNNAASKNYGWFELRVNGTTVGYECIANIYSNSFCTGTLAPAILSVSNGDVITLYNKEAGTNIRKEATYLTVEVVA